MKISFDIPAQRIADLMTTTIEVNHMTRSWCNGVFLKGSWGKKYDTDASLLSPWYSNPAIYEGEFRNHRRKQTANAEQHQEA